MTSSKKSKLFTKNKVLVVLGPTSSGKSALAITLAKKFNGEVISADSRQAYKGFNLTSGKVTKREMQGVQHHLLDVASPSRTFSVTRFQKLGKKAIRDILRRGKLPIICGGTGLYIDALIYDYQFPKAKLDKKLRKELEKLTTAELFDKLKKLDAGRAKIIDQNNPARLVRAIEIALQSDEPIPDLKTVFNKTSEYDLLKIGINPGSEILKDNIHKRILSRIKAGMIKEVKGLRKTLSDEHLMSFGLEYRWITKFLRSEISKSEMIKNLERDHKKYVKRQLTWWKKDEEITWIKDSEKAEVLVRKFI